MPALLLVLVVAAAGITEDPLFVDANRLFADLEFEQAAFRFEQLGMRSELDEKERALVLMWLGTCNAKAGDLDSAARSYEFALNFDTTAHAPVAVSPKVVRLIEAIRKVVVEKKRRARAKAEAAAATRVTSTLPSGTEREGTFPSDAEREGTGREGTGREGTGREGTEREGTGREGTEREGTGGSAAVVDVVDDGAKIEDGWGAADASRGPSSDASAEGGRNGGASVDVSTASSGTTPRSDDSWDRADGSSSVVLPLGIAFGVVGAALMSAAVVGGIFSALDFTAAFDIEKTQVEAAALYNRGLALGGLTAGAVILAVGAGGAAGGLLFFNATE